MPVNPYNFRDYRSGMLWVSFSGPLANFALAFISIFLFYLAPLWLGFYWRPYFQFMETLAAFNILLGIFNLIPVPPLDGSKILTALAPESMGGFLRQMEPYAPVLLMLLIFSGITRRVIGPLFRYVFTGMERLVLLILGLS